MTGANPGGGGGGGGPVAGKSAKDGIDVEK